MWPSVLLRGGTCLPDARDLCVALPVDAAYLSVAGAVDVTYLCVTRAVDAAYLGVAGSFDFADATGHDLRGGVSGGLRGFAQQLVPGVGDFPLGAVAGVVDAVLRRGFGPVDVANRQSTGVLHCLLGGFAGAGYAGFGGIAGLSDGCGDVLLGALNGAAVGVAGSGDGGDRCFLFLLDRGFGVLLALRDGGCGVGAGLG